jgi:hypothetical protein
MEGKELIDRDSYTWTIHNPMLYVTCYNYIPSNSKKRGMFERINNKLVINALSTLGYGL